MIGMICVENKCHFLLKNFLEAPYGLPDKVSSPYSGMEALSDLTHPLWDSTCTRHGGDTQVLNGDRQ